MSSLKSDLFVQFRVFYNKEFTGQKKVTNKLFISVRCVVIAKRGGGVRSAIWDSVGCVSMWWCMYIEGYIFVFFDILRKWGLSMFRFACFCLLSVTLFLYFLLSPPYMTFLTKSFFSFFLILFLNKNYFLIRNKIKKHIS